MANSCQCYQIVFFFPLKEDRRNLKFTVTLLINYPLELFFFAIHSSKGIFSYLFQRRLVQSLEISTSNLILSGIERLMEQNIIAIK